MGLRLLILSVRGPSLYVRIWRLRTSDSDVQRRSSRWKGQHFRSNLFPSHTDSDCRCIVHGNCNSYTPDSYQTVYGQWLCIKSLRIYGYFGIAWRAYLMGSNHWTSCTCMQIRAYGTDHIRIYRWPICLFIFLMSALWPDREINYWKKGQFNQVEHFALIMYFFPSDIYTTCHRYVMHRGIDHDE